MPSGMFQLFHMCFRDFGICPITVQGIVTVTGLAAGWRRTRLAA